MRASCRVQPQSMMRLSHIARIACTDSLPSLQCARYHAGFVTGSIRDAALWVCVAPLKSWLIVTSLLNQPFGISTPHERC